MHWIIVRAGHNRRGAVPVQPDLRVHRFARVRRGRVRVGGEVRVRDGDRGAVRGQRVRWYNLIDWLNAWKIGDMIIQGSCWARRSR